MCVCGCGCVCVRERERERERELKKTFADLQETLKFQPMETIVGDAQKGWAIQNCSLRISVLVWTGKHAKLKVKKLQRTIKI